MSDTTPRQRAMLRTCAADMTARGGFRWPEWGLVTAPDWNPEPVCGGGLHGLLDGCGDALLLCWDADARWLVVEVDEWVAIDDAKVKAPAGRVVFCGAKSSAVALGVERYGWDVGRCVGASVQVADEAHGTGGHRSTITGGNRSTITGGDRSTITGGYGSTITGGNRSTITGGDGSTITGGYGSTITGGDGSTITGGYRSTLTMRWWDGKRYRVATFYVGEDGIEAGVPYRVGEKGEAVRVEAEKETPT